MTEQTYSLRELKLLARGNVPLEISLGLLFADADEDILALVDNAIDHIAQDFAKTPKERQGRSEDSLTTDLVSSLRNMGFQASHDTTVGGHCDIVIQGRGNFLWLGEAKIHKDYDWLVQGFNQLDSRYATASRYQDHGGIVIYCYHGRVDKIMDEWAVRLKQARPEVQVSRRAEDIELFTSSHVHKRTGRLYHVRHVAIGLQWASI